MSRDDGDIQQPIFLDSIPDGEFLEPPLCARRIDINLPDLDFSDLIAMAERITAKECLRHFMEVQVKKFQAGKDLRSSDSLARKIRRMALEEDMGV